ncbi:MAG: DUF502 domain-containing protein [Paraglaciecola sp.]|uniref:DUF502 domain-containing protein n=1 Tax=Pseudomonadati TaxID=3379134 RepID=UPI00273E37CB|nr:DUF502 domain-containing protein [Paraglaciecola sp.]MDP5031387.1 DUF502 domain-containing protein [Paraglaciecola sp.]MDP5129919.1 DUF502 domain-containing protein [Paraglaciecola sp.]
MNKLLTLSFKGLVAVLPLTLTLYFVYWFMEGTEGLLQPFVPQHLYFPGLGILLACGIILVAGLLMNLYFINGLVGFFNRQIEKIPLVKSIYGAINDIMTVFSIKDKENSKAVVSIEIQPNMHLIGFVTGEKTGQQLFNDEDKVGVYVPLSYQIGGYTLYVKRSQITPLNIGAEEAMRIALTGGVKAEK